jgi:hypothetical protein
VEASTVGVGGGDVEGVSDLRPYPMVGSYFLRTST